ncbi:MAG: hypothetical protein WBC67_17450 [Candidatus Acidiferrales bacterium]
MIEAVLPFLPQQWSTWFYGFHYLPKWPLYIWIIGFLLILLCAVFEASFRLVVEATNLRVAAEQRLADEKDRKQTVKERNDETDAIVRKAALTSYRSLVKHMAGSAPPRFFLNEIWIRQVAEQNGRTVAEINEAIDRVDGTFHWQ